MAYKKLFCYDGPVYDGTVIYTRIKVYCHAYTKLQAISIIAGNINKDAGRKGLWLDQQYMKEETK